MIKIHDKYAFIDVFCDLAFQIVDIGKGFPIFLVRVQQNVKAGLFKCVNAAQAMLQLVCRV